MSEEQDIRQLLNDGITAAREGDKERARVLFEEVVAQDPENEKGWFWLASVAATDEERIVYLGNVVQINPGNERAQVLLDRLEAKQDSRPHSAMDEEIIPGVSRRISVLSRSRSSSNCVSSALRSSSSIWASDQRPSPFSPAKAW